MYKLFIICIFVISSSLQGDDNDNSVPQTELAEQVYESYNNNKKWPALHYALDQGYSEAAEWLLERHPEQANESTPVVWIWAVHMGYNDADDYDYVIGHDDGFSALELAVKHAESKLKSNIVQQLLMLGADPMQKRKEQPGTWRRLESRQYHNGNKVHYGSRGKFANTNTFEVFTPLYLAMIENKTDLVEFMLEASAKVDLVYINKTEQRDEYNLYQAAIQSDYVNNVINWALQQFDLETAPEQVRSTLLMYEGFGQSALLDALEARDHEAFTLLLQMQASPIGMQEESHLVDTLLAMNDASWWEEYVAYFGKDRSLNGSLNLLDKTVTQGNIDHLMILIQQDDNFSVDLTVYRDLCVIPHGRLEAAAYLLPFIIEDLDDATYIAALKAKNWDVLQLFIEERGISSEVLMKCLHRTKEDPEQQEMYEYFWQLWLEQNFE